ncbi:MAG TPA: hypothetical protein IAB17_05740 [Candidatus Alectryocaccobium stercorigallinarum]|nr:hypothetical protein [Candidatus Alectryocaccobium stercorigallinarum]
MDGNKRKRPVKKPENPVREWISDNLRYIMLFGGIALAVVIVVLAVRAFSGGDSAENNSQQVSTVNSDGDEAEQDNPNEADVEASDEDSQSDSLENSSIENDASAQESTDETSTDEQDADASLAPASESVVNVVSSYLNALAAKDAEAAAAVMESITDEDRAAIIQGSFAESYNNLEVYSYPGDTNGSYVAFAVYDYTYPGYATAVPALTQFYIITKSDGSMCVASDQTQEAKAEYMSSLLGRVDVAVLINTIQSEYEAALASDPALAEYIDSVSGQS